MNFLCYLQPHRKPHPPTSGRSSSRTSRLRHVPTSTSYSLGPTLNRNLCLPPVGHSLGSMGQSLALHHSILKERMERLEREEQKERAAAAFDSTLQAFASSSSHGDKVEGTIDLTESSSHHTTDEPVVTKEETECLDKFGQALLSSVKEVEAEKPSQPDIGKDNNSDMPANKKTWDSEKTENEGDEKPASDTEAVNCDNGTLSAAPSNVKRDLLRLNGMPTEAASDSRPVTSSKIKDVTLESLRESLRPPNSSKSKTKGEYSFLESLRETIGAASSMSRHSSLEKRKEFTLESLSSKEARVMSGLLRQASLEKVGSSRIGNVTVTSASRNRVTGNYTLGNSTFPDGRITTPEGRLMVC